MLYVFFFVQALADPYFQGLANVDYEPSRQPISKLEFEFERRKLTRDDVRELMYREVKWKDLEVIICVEIENMVWDWFVLFVDMKQILEYHPQMLQEYLQGEENINSHFLYPRFDPVSQLKSLVLRRNENLSWSWHSSGVDQFKQEFARLEEHDDDEEERNSPPMQRKYTSLPRWVLLLETEPPWDWVWADQAINRFWFLLQRTGVLIRGRGCWFGPCTIVFVFSGVYTSTDSKHSHWLVIAEDNTSRQSSKNSG